MDCIDFPYKKYNKEWILERTNRCAESGEAIESDRTIIGGILSFIKWKKGSNSVIIFNGDIIDNRRNNSQPIYLEYGVCAYTDSINAIINTICRLKKEAMQSNGDVIWVLGNHDIAPLLNDLECNVYSGTHYCDKMESKNYSEQFIAYMKIKINEAHAKATYSFQSGKKVFACAHGGFCKDFTDDNFRTINTINLFIDLFINKDYLLSSNLKNTERKFLNDQIKKYKLHLRKETLPTWCRYGDGGDEIVSSDHWPISDNHEKKVDTVIVAHTVGNGIRYQTKHNDLKSTTENNTSIPKNAKIIYTDMGMSRCFQSNDTKIGFITISNGKIKTNLFDRSEFKLENPKP